MTKLEQIMYLKKSPLIEETKKSPIKYVKHQKLGARKIKNRIKANKKGVNNG